MIEIGIDWVIKKSKKKQEGYNSKIEFYKQKRISLGHEITRVDGIIESLKKDKKDTKRCINEYERIREESPGFILFLDDKYYFELARNNVWTIEELEMEHNEIVKELVDLKTFRISRKEIEEKLERLDIINQEIKRRLFNSED